MENVVVLFIFATVFCAMEYVNVYSGEQEAPADRGGPGEGGGAGRDERDEDPGAGGGAQGEGQVS